MDALQMNNETVDAKPVEKKGGVSGSTLKLIAISAMLIDHIGAGILARYLMVYDYVGVAMSGNISALLAWLQEHQILFYTYTIMRMIGRIGFPIFCFLLVEGFQKTHDVKKYALRLGAFALISEIPFDLCFSGKILEFSYQNVFLTLFLGLLTMMTFDWIEKKLSVQKAIKVLLSAAALVFFAFTASFLQTDYGAIGVICIMVLYVFRKNKTWQIAAGCISFVWELTAPLAFIPIGFYNGRRGLKLKYVFYLFYPVHLFLIYLICVFLGIGGIAAV